MIIICFLATGRKKTMWPAKQVTESATSHYHNQIK